MEPDNQSNAHAVYNLKLHIVFVTKSDAIRGAPELWAYLEMASAQILTADGVRPTCWGSVVRQIMCTC